MGGFYHHHSLRLCITGLILVGGCILPWDRVEPSPGAAIDADVDEANPDADHEPDGETELCEGAECELVAHWLFDDDGLIAEDVTGNGNDCAIHDATSIDDGVVGSALRFDGALAFLQCEDTLSIDTISSRITVAAFVRRHAWQESYRALVQREVGVGHYEHFFFGFLNNEFRWTVLTDEYSQPASFEMSDEHLGVWMHVAGTYDGVELALYVNGERYSSLEHTGTLSPDSSGITMGAETNDGGTTWRAHADASLDDVRIYREALSEQEIDALAQALAD